MFSGLRHCLHAPPSVPAELAWCAATKAQATPQLSTECTCTHGHMSSHQRITIIIHFMVGILLPSHRPSVQLAEGLPELHFNKPAAVAAPKAAQAAWWADGALAVMTLDRQLQLQSVGGACSPLIQAVRPAPGASCLMLGTEAMHLTL